MTATRTEREATEERDPATELQEWLALDDAIEQLRIITGDLDDRRVELDELEAAATANGIPVVRLDGRASSEWTASLSAQLGPLTLRLEVSSTPSEPRPETRPPTAPDPAPTVGGPRTDTDLASAFDRFRELARDHGGIVVIVDDLHRVPAATRDQLFDALEGLSGSVLVAGSDRSSVADLTRAFDRSQLDASGVDRATTPTTGVTVDPDLHTPSAPTLAPAGGLGH